MDKKIKFLLVIFLFYGCNSSLEIRHRPEKNPVKKFILNNGLTILARQIANHHLVSLELLVKTGSAKEGAYAGTGISHFLEHLIFKGTEKYTAGEIARYLKLLGGEIKAFTTHEYTSFVVTVPADKVEKALEVLKESVLNPALREEDFLRERQVILKEILMNEDEPERRIFRLFWQNFYRLHPYKYPVIGYKELFSKLTLEEIRNYHKVNYVPNNMLLSIVGGISDEDLEKVKTTFSQIERGKEKQHIGVIEPAHISPYVYEENYPTKLMYLMLGFPGVEINHHDLYALDLLATLLGGGKSSRLYQRLIIRENLAYNLSSFNHTPGERGIFGIYLIGEYKDQEKIIKTIWEEIRRLKKFSPSAGEVDKAKNILLHQYYLEHERVEDQAHQLALGELFSRNPEFYSFYLNKIKMVKPRELKRIAKKYLREESLTLVSLIPPHSQEKISEPKEIQEYNEEIKKISLKNGLTLLLKEDHTLPLTCFQVVCLGGLRLEKKENNGVSNLCAHLLTRGTLYKSAEEINRLVEKYGGSLNAFSGNNSLGLSLNIISKNTLPGINLLAEIIKFANFSKEEFLKEKNQINARIKEREEDPIAYLLKLVKKGLFLRHPYGMDILGEKETIENLKLEEVRDFYQRVINPKNCLISIWGDFKKEEVERKIKKEFSSWKPGGNFLFLKNETEPPLSSPRIIKEKTDKKQGLVAIGFHTVSLYSPQYSAFRVLEEILGGQGNRLFEKIREKLGLVYFVDVYQIAGLDTGYFVFLTSTDKDNLENVKELLLEEVKNLREGKFYSEEIERAKAYIVEEQRRELQTRENFSRITALDELYGLGFDHYKEYAKKINSVSIKDLQDIVQRYFREDNYVLIELLPED
ncbi:MAG: M16 family metallopeptidase [Candidatus Omnitrophota bacterium]